MAAPLTEEQGYELFARATRGLLLTWPLLVFSKTHGTGGKDTVEKIDDIVEDVLHNFKERWERADVDIRAKSARVYVEEVAPFLYEVMEKDLNLEIEDSSPEMYAGHIIRMFEACRFKSNFTPKVCDIFIIIGIDYTFITRLIFCTTQKNYD
ncbi:MAG: Uncharacterised protein [uncultured Bacteroidota bacterium]|nr:MAG: Uncharacterised protein [uncultured Bacteroidetes bacterium]